MSSELFEAVSAAVRDGLEHVRQMKEQGKTIIGHLRFPTISTFSSGLPHLSVQLFNGPPDYLDAFSRDKDWKAPPSWKVVGDLALRSVALRRYYPGAGNGALDDAALNDPERVQRIDSEVQMTLKRLVDRYVNIAGHTDFEAETFLPIYREWERCALLDELTFDILVPLLLVKVEAGSLDLGPDLAIEEMSELLQLARAERPEDATPRSSPLVGAATHALALKNWVMKNDSWINRWVQSREPQAFADATHVVNVFMAALRIVTGIETGYAQIVTRPHNWGDRWEAYLPDISIAQVKVYPDHFDNQGWWRTPPTLTAEQCQQAYQLYEALSQSKSNKIALACRRLNTAYLRQNEEDAILDVTIALETLLADDGRGGEITYRLAMRIAGLSTFEPFETHSAEDVFKMVKQIYNYRSAVAHGSHDVEKRRVVSLKHQPEPIPTIRLGLALLRYVMGVVSRRPAMLDVQALDAHLLNAFRPL